MKTKWIVIGILAVLMFWAFGNYNGLVTNEEKVNSAWSQIDTQLQRRLDLIPNLVATAKGFAKQEQTIFTNIADARAKLAGAQTVAGKAAADSELSGALSRLLVVVENYPNLKSDTTFRQLMDELAGTENRIATARKDYNDAVQTFNTKLKVFPTVIFANIFGFDAKEYFKAEAGAESTPKVDFDQ